MCCEGLLVVVSGPSGAGKGTLLNLLKDSGDDSIRFSVSATTRTPEKARWTDRIIFLKPKMNLSL
ncbi:guanylate kinase [Acetivibrio straminisolvens JCM 21531]|uniref:Guanylate kinase n=1 Tax=Acetivibrio straminisolvens JCM 21531 TaxID=1294263 RepID=W4V6E5_9FIRM|nr:guanylate kinase [Acetivibrio straminisolvens JCM 21531]